MKKVLFLSLLMFSQLSFSSSLVFNCKSTKDIFSNAFRIDGVTINFNIQNDIVTLFRSTKSGGKEISNYAYELTEVSGPKTKFTYVSKVNPNQKLDFIIKSGSFGDSLTLDAVLFVYDDLGIENANELLCKKRL